MSCVDSCVTPALKTFRKLCGSESNLQNGGTEQVIPCESSDALLHLGLRFQGLTV